MISLHTGRSDSQASTGKNFHSDFRKNTGLPQPVKEVKSLTRNSKGVLASLRRVSGGVGVLRRAGGTCRCEWAARGDAGGGSSGERGLGSGMRDM